MNLAQQNRDRFFSFFTKGNEDNKEVETKSIYYLQKIMLHPGICVYKSKAWNALFVAFCLKFFLGPLCVFSLICFVGISVSHGLVIDPIRTKLFVPQGVETNASITIKNEKPDMIRIGLQFRDMSSQKGASDWINMETGEINLAPSESKTIYYSVTVPTNATGEFYGRISFLDLPPESESKATIGLRTSISVPLVVIIKGTEAYGLDIQKVNIKQRGKQPMLEFSALNTGNIHLRPKGTCKITREGEEDPFMTVGVNVQGFPVYPGRTEKLMANLNRRIEAGIYKINVFLHVEDDVITNHFSLKIP